MSPRPTGRSTRLILSVQVGILLVFMIASAAVRVFDLGWWWIAPIAIVAFTLTLLLGRSYDRAQHAELSVPTQP